MKILRCEKAVRELLEKIDLQEKVEEAVYAINGTAGLLIDQTELLGHIPMHLSRDGERVVAQVQIKVTINPDDFIGPEERHPLTTHNSKLKNDPDHPPARSI